MPESKSSASCHGHAGHAHAHAHGADAPHPPQPPSWSLLRMTAVGRLLVAAALSAALWALVLTVLHA
jgi:hypothetical protein